MMVTAWIRQILRAVRRRKSRGDVRKKLDAIREAARYSFPAGDIDQMLKEIEQGYLSDRSQS